MNTILAVATQIVSAASNFIVFVLLSHLLSPSEFTGFSTALGLNMFASAIGEGGISLVAPHAISERSKAGNPNLAGAFLMIGIALYMAATMVGFFVWNVFATDLLDARWVAAYLIFFLPGLLVPSWAIVYAMDLSGFLVLVALRGSMIAAVWLSPGPLGLALAGCCFSASLCGLIPYLNRRQPSLLLPRCRDLSIAVDKVRTVFAARMMSFVVYASLPMLIGVIQGNLAASEFVAGERMKGVYATLFHPFIQTSYLRRFQASSHRHRTKWILHGLNIVACAGVLVANHLGIAQHLGEGIARVHELSVYLLAGTLATATAIELYLDVFPAGNMVVFRRAAIVQMAAFGVGLSLMGFWKFLSPGTALLLGETALLLAVALQRLPPRLFGNGRL
ncbi:hypothetical protein KQX63_23810 [Rhodopseudomonas palustris]|uniref:hypothetical protein n=1 Tax=Rhodopseudomonas palustris TaxID=1076 RepID=UPI0021F282C7|nr:hypothetical protein [Rhodopseudomonas palustris]UYO44340.1 hypothetical protein KQX63_23810 [Rhodopseudomonas palustris]